MNIKTIHIKNVRGIGDKTIQLGMIPNKPSLLVAPNGSGKSSFALAFQWLNMKRLKLDPDNAYNGNCDNKPELAIATDESITYVADENHNDISKRFGIFVINNGRTAKTPKVYGSMLASKARLVVPDIEILNESVEKTDIEDDFEEVYEIDAPVGIFPVINSLLDNNRFMSLLDYEQLRITARPMGKLLDIINDIKTNTETKDDCHKKFLVQHKMTLDAVSPIQYVVSLLKKFWPKDTDAKLLLKALRIVTLSYRKSDEIKMRIKYARYKLNEESIKKTFDTLKKTWKDIKPHREGNLVSLKIGDAQRISNGERDILQLIAKLLEAKSKLTKIDNILVIDEVFDYLDDANLIAAQHYINLFISELKNEGKNIYPIILTHINPTFYRTFAFRDMKVYYLNALPNPHASDNMMKLVRRRDELERINKDDSDLISKYMFHFHTDYTQNMTIVIKMTEPNWGDIPTFKTYCLNQVDKYLQGESYDSLGVCVALREMIEKYCYCYLQTDEQRAMFFDEKYCTENKIDYCESLGVVIPETFSIMGLVYNDSLHFNNKNQIDLRQTLYSRLENSTIRSIVEEIKSLYDKLG